MKSFATLAFLLLTSSQVFADASCTDKIEALGNTQVHLMAGAQSCMLSLTPRGDAMSYRSFLIQNNGLFMVFNSLSGGAEEGATGAREYFFFPRTHKLDYRFDAAAKRVYVTSPSGKIFEFDTEKTRLVSITGTEFTTDHVIQPGNGGGIEITRNDKVYLDLGFQLGHSPSQNPQRKVQFKDLKNKSCEVSNSEIFKYTSDQDVYFKYSDAQLTRFLARRCPQLVL